MTCCVLPCHVELRTENYKGSLLLPPRQRGTQVQGARSPRGVAALSGWRRVPRCLRRVAPVARRRARHRRGVARVRCACKDGAGNATGSAISSVCWNRAGARCSQGPACEQAPRPCHCSAIQGSSAPKLARGRQCACARAPLACPRSSACRARTCSRATLVRMHLWVLAVSPHGSAPAPCSFFVGVSQTILSLWLTEPACSYESSTG